MNAACSAAVLQCCSALVTPRCSLLDPPLLQGYWRDHRTGMALYFVHTEYRPSVQCSPQYPCCRLTAVGSCSGYYPPPISAQHSTAGDDSILLLQGLAWKCFASSWRSRTLPQMFSFYYCINVPWHMTITDDVIKRKHRIGFWLIFKWNILDVIVWTIKMRNGMQYYLVPSLGLL